MTVSFLIPEEKPKNLFTATALNLPYTRIYKKIDFNMNAGKIAQMRMFTEYMDIPLLDFKGIINQHPYFKIK
ncbi:hypothetical protein H0R92_13700 [Treponema sp. OMZ 840]|uniref:hypothetical protein n=1 Tax=Treponema sp. OMZ 840 TaxID=244313 RepID=UPI003D8EAA07